MKKKDEYAFDIVCNNCNRIVWFDIKKGVTTEEHLKKNKLCPICGCEHS